MEQLYPIPQSEILHITQLSAVPHLGSYFLSSGPSSHLLLLGSGSPRVGRRH